MDLDSLDHVNVISKVLRLGIRIIKIIRYSNDCKGGSQSQFTMNGVIVKIGCYSKKNESGFIRHFSEF